MATTDAPPPTAPPDEGLDRPRRWVQIGFVLGAVLLGLGIILAVPWMRHSFVLCLHGDFAGLRTYIRGLGTGGLALLLGLMLMHALVYYPTELVTTTTAFIYGWLPRPAVAMAGWLLSALLSYLLGAAAGRPVAALAAGGRLPSLRT